MSESFARAATQNVHKFFSSGGLGDAWIAFLKIWDVVFDGIDDKVIWNHSTSHEFHRDSISQLMGLMPGIVEANVHTITKATMGKVEAQHVDKDTKRLRSTAFDIVDPTPGLTDILGPKVNLDKPIAIIQPAAGRPDRSFRHFTPYAVNTLIQQFHDRGKEVVLLGFKYSSAVPEGVNNLTGKTPIGTALKLIYSAEDFIGFDGFLAYVAMSMKVRSRVAFHAPGLSHHYSHPEWRKHSEFCLTTQKINEPFCLNWGQV